MEGDCLGASGRAAGEQPGDLRGEPLPQVAVVDGSPLRVAHAAPRAGVRVGEALLLGARQRILLDENALTLVALACAAEAHDDSRQLAGGLGAPGHRGLPRR